MLKAKTRISEDVADVGIASPCIFVCSRLFASNCVCLTMRLKENVLCESEKADAIERCHIRNLQIPNISTNKTKSLESSILHTLKISDLCFFQICYFTFPDFREAPQNNASRGTSPTGGCGWFKVMWDENGSQRHEKV